MSFISKILDTFKMESTRESGNTGIASGREVLYHDRFDEEYREVNNYREITFNGKNFNVPEVQLCVAILLDGSEDGDRIRESNHYALYFEGRYGIMNIGELHQWLYEKGYLRNASLREALSLYKVPELKMMLDSMGLKKTGNKAVLIDRIVDNIDSDQKHMILNKCEHVFLSEKGAAFLDENGDYARWHRKSYGVTFEEFNKHRTPFSYGKRREFHDTIFHALNEKACTYQYKQWFSKLEMIYFWLGESLYDEGRYDLAIRHYMYRLYFSTNLASHSYLFNLESVRRDGIESKKRWIKEVNDTFNKCSLQKIVELKEYYNEQILDIIYGLHILPYCIFDKIDMSNAMNDLLNGESFDVEHYTDYICSRYERYIKKFL